MASDGEYELVVFPVEVVKMVAPDIFDIAWIHPPMAVGAVLDEHLPRVSIPL